MILSSYFKIHYQKLLKVETHLSKKVLYKNSSVRSLPFYTLHVEVYL